MTECDTETRKTSQKKSNEIVSDQIEKKLLLKFTENKDIDEELQGKVKELYQK